MNDGADVPLVDANAECGCCHDGVELIVRPEVDYPPAVNVACFAVEAFAAREPFPPKALQPLPGIVPLSHVQDERPRGMPNCLQDLRRLASVIRVSMHPIFGFWPQVDRCNHLDGVGRTK